MPYVFDQKFHWVSGFWSSESLILTAAVAAKTGTFDIRTTGAVNAAIFLTAFWLLLPLLDPHPSGFRMVVLAMIVLISRT